MIFRNRSACTPLAMMSNDGCAVSPDAHHHHHHHHHHHNHNHNQRHPHHCTSYEEGEEQERVRQVLDSMLSNQAKFQLAHQAMYKVEKLQELAFTASINRTTDLGGGSGGRGGGGCGVPAGASMPPLSPLHKEQHRDHHLHAKRRSSNRGNLHKCGIPKFVGFDTQVEQPERL